MKRTITYSVAVLILSGAAFAQTSEAGKRAENQQDRIAQGVKSGQLTAGETANLERKEAAIHSEVKTDRALNGGKLTAREKATVNAQQSNLSKQVYQDKHNASVAHYGNNTVGARRENQQDRIANGVASGKLNATQAAKIEKGEAALNKEVGADRKANGGKLTTAQKGQVNQQQNQLSRQIRHDKGK